MAQPLPSNILDTCTDGFFICWGRYMNEVTGGLFWAGSLLAFCMVLFIASISTFGRTRAFGFAGFAAIMGGIFLAIMEFLDWGIASAFILTGVLGFVVLILNEK